MKKYLTLIFIICTLSNNIFSADLYKGLLKINKQWKHQKDAQIADLQTIEVNLNHNQMISVHLSLVESILRKRSINHLNPSQKTNRLARLNDLNNYWKEAKYPKNKDYDYVIPYFIDDENTACAVGELVIKSGFSNVAYDIATSQNNAYLSEIVNKDLKNWAKNNGFTLEELAWIQPGYYYSPNCITNANIEIYSSQKNETCSEGNGFIKIDSVTSSNVDIIYVDWLDSNEFSRFDLNSGIYTFYVHYHNDGAFTTCDVPFEFVIENEISENCFKPIANNDIISSKSNRINFSVLSNDSDPNDDELSLKIKTLPTSGKLVLNSDNSFDFTFENEKECSFYYQICDVENYCDTGKVTMLREKNEVNEILAYPNPAKEKITFVSNNSEIERLEIFDCNGQMKISTNGYVAEITNLKAGNYIVRLYNKNGTVGAKYFIKI